MVSPVAAAVNVDLADSLVSTTNNVVHWAAHLVFGTAAGLTTLVTRRRL